MKAQQLQIAIIGGGIAGLATAYNLARHGVNVTVFEGSDRFGGLGTFFEHDSGIYEKFYHCMLPGDEPLLDLIEKLGASERVYWSDSKFGYLNNEKLFPLNAALDLLRFSPLSILDRIRVGLTGLYGSFCSDKGLDNITAAKWLSSLSGKTAFQTFWLPMLEAKFGNRYDGIPALWFWSRFNREKGKQKEVKGYIKGGYKYLADKLIDEITQLGGVLKTNSAVEELGLEDAGQVLLGIDGLEYHFDQVILTLAPPALRRLSYDKQLGETLRPLIEGIDYQGVVNSVLLLKRPLTDYYWIATPEPHIPFQGIVETTTLIKPEDSSGNHIVHLMNYCQKESSLFQLDDELIKKQREDALFAIFPDLEQRDIITHEVFRAPMVEPIYSLGYQRRKPPIEIVKQRVYLATSAQVYPDVTSWNASCGLARSVAKIILDS